ncbi:atypical PilZ domain-containing cyclic di-GMP receptor [Luteimonas cucumeris]|uniref:Atypical PilZ domain-containing cyclic di-GMP receptor n=1 Tax=Luteimonas cucumeris TaxID=985012 RepID=A0A562L582_9GAMM|nr:PilZ domain-containing protein [Luteimonas cucumeris]TWI02783.1 atypical PilZ domain-containing cyclic di-GMP receptor [Luteimonas cucumeris]
MGQATAIAGHGAEIELFSDTLSCDVVLPARFDPGPAMAAQHAAESLLHGLAIAEDVRSDDNEERGELPQSMQRVEAKLDLILGVLGKLTRARADALPVRHARWSHRGLRLDLPATSGFSTGDSGVLLLQPADWLSDHIELPARVLAEMPGQDGHHHLWLRFGTLLPGLHDALERHLFRLHRRQIAEARRLR